MNDPLDQILFDSIGEAASQLISDDASAAPQPGERILHYRLIEGIGEGGMGVVFKAEDEKLKRFVALKFLASRYAGDALLRERIEREACAASALNHPSICTIHDFLDEGARHFIVMEYLEGETLKERLKRGPLAQDEAVRIVRSVAAALEAAHEKNIVHCDVKPANIFLPAGGGVKVLDFGIAQFKRSATEVIEPDSLAAGTQGYMSPEQERGELVDCRTDVFSLGAVLKSMVPAPSPALRRVIDRMLQPDRDRRFPKMAEADSALGAVQRRGVRRRVVLRVAVAVVIIAAFIGAWLTSRPALARRDWILIAEVENRTGDPTFDDILKDAIEADVAQSPYLNVYPAAQIREQLKLMLKPPDQPLTRAVARELCERAGVKAFIAGSISTVGSHYLLTLDAVKSGSGEYIARQAIDIGSKETVLNSVGRAAVALRKSLGDSYASMPGFSVPLETATTSSLDALRMFRAGQAQIDNGTGASAKAVPLLKRAIEIDPDFALAYARLGQAYANIRQQRLSQDAERAAFERRSRVSQREKFEIEVRYYDNVTGEHFKAIETLEIWLQTYPQDAAPHNLVGVLYKNLGQLEKAAQEFETAVHLLPSAALFRSNLCTAYLRLTDLDRAKTVCEQAVHDKVDDTTTHRMLHAIALMQGDEEGIRREEAWRAKNTAAYATLEFQANIDGIHGQLKEARDLFRQAIGLAEQAKLDDRAAEYSGRFALLEAFIGDPHESANIAQKLLATGVGEYAESLAVIALAISGDPSAPAAIEQHLQKFSTDDYVKQIVTPIARSILDIQAGNLSKAIDTLELTTAYDRGETARLFPSYYIGVAQLGLHSGPEAVKAFQKVIDNRGMLATNPDYSLPYLGLARAEALNGQRQDAIAAYEKLFELWKDADPDLPLLKTAREEYGKLRTAS